MFQFQDILSCILFYFFVWHSFLWLARCRIWGLINYSLCFLKEFGWTLTLMIHTRYTLQDIYLFYFISIWLCPLLMLPFTCSFWDILGFASFVFARWIYYTLGSSSSACWWIKSIGWFNAYYSVRWAWYF